MSQCPVCGKSFTRSDNLKRHIKNIHEKITPEMPVHRPVHHQCGSCINVSLPKLIHPFTCLVAGPTGSGKTLFLKKLLELKNERYTNAQNQSDCSIKSHHQPIRLLHTTVHAQTEPNLPSMYGGLNVVM